MGRLQGVNLAEVGWLRRLWLRFVYWMTRRRVGRVIEPVRVMAHHGRLLMGVGMMEEALRKSRRVAERTKVLVSIRAATLIGCPF